MTEGVYALAVTVIIGGAIILAFGAYKKITEPEPVPNVVNVHAITMPENCYDQLKNANMVQIKILR
jgi:hypothetical protein